VLLAACEYGHREIDTPEDDSDVDVLIEREKEYEARFLETPIDVRGEIVDASGNGIDGATISAQDQETTTDEDGRFTFRGLERRTSHVTVTADGHHTTVVPVWLHRPLDLEHLDLAPVVMPPKTEAEARVLFSGDVSLGRRFLHENPPIDRVPPIDPEALIPVDDVESSTREVLAAIRPLLQNVDFVSINLETVVTDRPDTPFDSKPYVFFTLPESLPALSWAGVDYVALGNNHIYDYLEQGVVDTLDHLDTANIPHSGAGMTPDDAFEPFRTTIRGHDFSFVSVSSIDGSQYPILFVANEEKAGGAYAWDSRRFEPLLQQESSAGRVTIVNMHTGSEYTELPRESSHGRMLFAAENGATAVIAHHPHVAQGFEWHSGALVAHSLGNFVFDQERLETLLGLLVEVDMEGPDIRRVHGVPVYIEKFRPRLVTGEVADVFLRRIAQASSTYGTPTRLQNGRIEVLRPDDTPIWSERTVTVDIAVGEEGHGFVDLRAIREPGESVASVDAPGLSGRLGRDIMTFGDMEDVDVDSDRHEITHWYTTGGSSFPCLRQTHRGTVALCAHRRAGDSTPSIVNFRNRIRTLGNATDEPNKEITLVAWMQGENAGRTTIDVGYFAPLGEREFGEERAVDTIVGDSDWEPHWFDLSMPPEDAERPTSRTHNPRALRVFVKHHAPSEGEGMLRLDDFAAVTWVSDTRFEDAYSTDSPNPYDFVRFDGSPGETSVTITFRSLRRGQEEQQ
jgi:hypothetical protein